MTLSSLIAKAGRFLRLFVDLAVLAGLAVGFYIWLDRNFRRVMNDRFKPYDSYIRGAFALGNDKYDDAMLAFDVAFPSFSKNPNDPLNRTILSVLCNNYLFALSNCEHHDRYAGQFAKISKLVFENTIPPEAADFTSIGWIELRTGELALAEKAFKRAIQLASVRQDDTDTAGAYRGLLLVNLAAGNIPVAKADLDESDLHNPSGCSQCDLDATSISNKELILIYPKFGTALASLKQQLPDVYDAYPITKSAPHFQRPDVSPKKKRNETAVHTDRSQ